METKICSKCKKELPLTIEYFDKVKVNKDDFSGQCKICRSEYKKQYHHDHYEENKEHLKERQKLWAINNKEHYQKYEKIYRETHKEHYSEYGKKYRKENPEKCLESHRKYYEKNKEKLTEYAKQYKENNKEHYIEYGKQWRKKNSGKANISNQRYKTKKRELLRTLTLKQWEAIKRHFDNRCCYCDKKLPLQQEHFIPLSKGGEYTLNNIIPACKSCNSSKNNTDFFIWYPKQSYYSKDREQKILKYLNYKDNLQQLKII